MKSASKKNATNKSATSKNTSASIKNTPNSKSWKVFLSIAVLLSAIAFVLPNFQAIEQSSIGKILPNSKINLGLDLKGGVSLTLGVQVDEAIKNLLAARGQDVRTYANDEEKILVLNPRIVNNLLELTLPRSADASAFNALLAKQFSGLRILVDEIGANNEILYKIQFTDEERVLLEAEILDQAVKTIRNRIDQFGVAEPDIRKQADNRIQIQLPGMEDPERAIQLVGQTAALSFHLVRDDITPGSFMLPQGTASFPMQSLQPDGSVRHSQIILDSTALMTGVDITDARPSYGENGTIHVSLEFNSKGASQFARVTGDNVGKRIAIVLDGTVFSAPVVNEKISGGRASISGSSSIHEAQDLAITLRAGALPAPVEVLEERTVGPSLGAVSISAGLSAALIGALAVILILPVYYSKAGLIADAMLCFTILLLMAGLGLFGATLTLPGIAGIVLTIGMAVDANVLIYERIREELAKGLSAIEAVHAGFARASISIMDSNITTMLVAIILYQFGTGPVRGFAITLGIGLIASFFTAVFVSREVFMLWLTKTDTKNISI